MQKFFRLIIALIALQCTFGPAVVVNGQEDWSLRADEVRVYQNTPITTLSDQDKRKIIQWAEEAVRAVQRVFDSNGQPLGEAYGEYYIDLILLIAKLRDPRAIPVLAKAVDVANGVGTSLAEFGDAAVDPVIRVLSEPQLTEGAVYTLGKLVQGAKIGKNRLSSQSLTRIRRELLRMTQHKSPEVRIEAVQALAFLDPDKDVLGTLERIAASDAYHRTREIDGTGVYPVRQAAKAVLEKIKK